MVCNLRGEECSEDVPDEAANAVNSEDIEGVVAAEEVLELRSVVASNTTAHTKNNCSPGRDVSRTRSNTNKTSNDTGAEANGGPLAFQTVVNQAPGDTTNTGCEIGAYSSHNSTEVGR